MPFLSSNYRPPVFLRSGHLQTIFSSNFRFVPAVAYERERITTPDKDFLDLDWSRVGSSKLVVISHGLEGDSGRTYVRGMVGAVNRRRWDALAWNFRGCSGEPNRLLRFYHSGDTEDLEWVLRHVALTRYYSEIALVGFSLGGNVTLKYLGESGSRLDAPVRCAVAISVPCDLASSALVLARGPNLIYMNRFLRKLHSKIRLKSALFPGLISDQGYVEIRNFRDFDDRYTARVHGFASAEDYWEKSSCRQFLCGIRIPALLINAMDDPFLGTECYPVQEAESSPCFHLEVPYWGGHVGFMALGGEYWSESRATSFISQHI